MPCVDAAAANAAVTAGRQGTLRPRRESITLLRNQNNALPLSPIGKVVVTGPSADSMTNQLGGWSVSWQGVFGAGHVCCMGPANQIPPGTTVLKGIQAADPNAVSAPDQAAALAAGGHGQRLCRRGRREGLRRRAGRQPGARAAAGPAGADHAR